MPRDIIAYRPMVAAAARKAVNIVSRICHLSVGLSGSASIGPALSFSRGGNRMAFPAMEGDTRRGPRE